MNCFGSLQKRFLVAAGIGLLAISTPLPASAADQTKNEHCLLTVTGKDKNNVFTTAPMKCFATFAEVLRNAGPAEVADDITPAKAHATGVLQRDSVIGVHYEYASGTGATLSVNGTTCTGGGLNVPLAWNDRISSTFNGCPTILHYENTGYTGASAATYTPGNITTITGYMDNKTSAILYY